MKRIYYLSTCSTCQRIVKELNLPEGYELRDIKKDPITPKELDELKKLAGSYEKLFSKRALLYKSWNLSSQNLGEEDFRKYILEHYTFLKRPVIVNGSKIFIGNAPKTIAEVKSHL